MSPAATVDVVLLREAVARLRQSRSPAAHTVLEQLLARYGHLLGEQHAAA